MPDFEESLGELGLGGIVDFQSAFNDDTTNLNAAKKKNIAKDTYANKPA